MVDFHLFFLICFERCQVTSEVGSNRAQFLRREIRSHTDQKMDVLLIVEVKFSVAGTVQACFNARAMRAAGRFTQYCDRNEPD